MSKKKGKPQPAPEAKPRTAGSSASMFGWALPGLLGAIVASLVVAGLSYVSGADSVFFSFLVPLFAGFGYLTSALLAFRKGEEGAKGFVVGWMAFVVLMPLAGLVLQTTAFPVGWALPIWLVAAVSLVLAVVFTVLFFWRGWGARFLPKSALPSQPPVSNATTGEEGDAGVLREVTRGSKLAGTVLTNILQQAGWGNSGQLARMTLENEGLRHTSGVLAENNRARELDLKERAAAIENYRAAKADGVTGTRLQVLFEKAYGADEAKPATPEPARARNWKGGKTRVF